MKSSTDPAALAELIPQGKYLVIFDGVCNLCNWSVNFIIKRDRKKHFMFAAFQEESAQKVVEAFDLADESPSTTFLIEGNKLYKGSTAALRIARRLRFPWPLTWPLMIVPRFLREWYYNIIARNRYKWWGKRDICRIPTPEEKYRFLPS